MKHAPQFNKIHVLTTILLFVCVYTKWSIYWWFFLITNLVIFWHWQEHTQTCGDKVFRVFDRVVVQLTIDQSNLQHLKLQTKLVEPKVRLIATCTSNGLLKQDHYPLIKTQNGNYVNLYFNKVLCCMHLSLWYVGTGNWRPFYFGRLRVLVFLPPHPQRPVMSHHWRRKRKLEKLNV